MMMYLSITIHQLFIVYISVPDELRELSSTDVYDDDVDDDDDDDDDVLYVLMLM